MSFRDTLIARLKADGVTEEALALSIGQVIQGQTVKKTYLVLDGEEKLVKKEVLVKPADAARGAMLYDALHGGELGLAPRVLDKSDSRQDLYRRFAPTINTDIMPVVHPALSDSTTPTELVMDSIAASDDETF